MPRAVQGSSAHVPIPDEVRQLQEQAYNITRSEESLESDETVAIPKHVLDKTERKPLQGLESENTSQESNENPESGNERILAYIWTVNKRDKHAKGGVNGTAERT